MTTCVVALAACLVLAAPAQATIDTAGFSLKISEKEGALSDPTDDMMMKYLMWDLGADRMVDRNMPYLELRNDDDSDAPITEFRLTIGDTRFNFNCQILQSCAMVAKSTSDKKVTSSVESGGDVLVLAIDDGGLQPGDVLRFKIALGADSNNVFQHPDFRTVLFDMNGLNVYDGNQHTPSSVDGSADNSKATAKYEVNSSSLLVGPVAFDDFSVMGTPGQYYNDIYRRYGVMERVDTFPLFAQGGVIPEPSTMIMAVVGLMGLAVRRARLRR